MANPKGLLWWKQRTLREIGLLPESWVKSQERAYVAWLAARRGTSERDAETHARSFPFGGEVDVATAGRVRESERIGAAIIRTVRVAGSRHHYNPELDIWHRTHWERLSKPDAPTVYMVELNGRTLNSFLRKSAARAFAETLAVVDAIAA